MDVFEAIKRFREFEIGDCVLWNNKILLEIVDLPLFTHRLYYSNGDHTDYFSKDIEDGSIYKTQQVLGYLVRDQQGSEFRLHLLANLTLYENNK